jgi:hypothetical protein
MQVKNKLWIALGGVLLIAIGLVMLYWLVHNVRT